MQPIKLLLDENLSPTIGVHLCNDGVDVAHVRDRGLNGASDEQVMDRAFDEDRILVTKNVGDFAKLARARELHAGIVLISPRFEARVLNRKLSAWLCDTS